MVASQAEHGEMYLRLKELQRQLEILEIQEEYIKDETKNLKREMIRAKVCSCSIRIHFIRILGGNSARAISSAGDWAVF